MEFKLYFLRINQLHLIIYEGVIIRLLRQLSVQINGYLSDTLILY